MGDIDRQSAGGGSTPGDNGFELAAVRVGPCDVAIGENLVCFTVYGIVRFDVQIDQIVGFEFTGFGSVEIRLSDNAHVSGPI